MEKEKCTWKGNYKRNIIEIKLFLFAQQGRDGLEQELLNEDGPRAVLATAPFQNENLSCPFDCIS